MTDDRRRFPPPWEIEEHNQSCFIVRDNNGQALNYVYFETDPAGAPRPTADARRARRIAANIARLPDLLGAAPKPDPFIVINGRLNLLVVGRVVAVSGIPEIWQHENTHYCRSFFRGSS